MTSSERFLDLRSLHRQEQARPLPLATATVTVTADGWTLQGQRRQKTFGAHVQYMLCVSITAPDGRVLHLTAAAAQQGTASGQIGHLLDGDVPLLLRKNPTASQTERGLASLIRAFHVGWDHALAPTRQHPDPITIPGLRPNAMDVRDLMKAAAFNIDPAIIAEIRKTADPLDRSSRNWDWNGLAVSTCVLLHQFGFTPADAITWIGKVQYLTKVDLTSATAFQKNGWTVEQRDALRDRLDLKSWDTVPHTWAALTPEQANLAVDAGLGPVEAARLVRQGRFDTDALAALAAFRTARTGHLAFQPV